MGLAHLLVYQNQARLYTMYKARCVYSFVWAWDWVLLYCHITLSLTCQLEALKNRLNLNTPNCDIWSCSVYLDPQTACEKANVILSVIIYQHRANQTLPLMLYIYIQIYSTYCNTLEQVK